MATEKAVVGISYERISFLSSRGDKANQVFMQRRKGLFCKINALILIVLVFFTTNTVFANVAAQNISSLPNNEREAVLDMIAHINHINWVINTIKTYNNSIVLEEERDKISPGNLCLSRIHDKDTADRITRILDTLHSFSMNDRQMKRWREDFKECRERERKTYFLKASKQAVDMLMGQAKECCSLWSWATNPVGSTLNVAHAAFNVAHYSVSLYNDYDNFVYELDKTAKDKQFDFDTAKLAILHQQNKDLLKDQWQFIHRYQLDDKLRVSDTDIKILLECLNDDDHSRIYTRLEPMHEHFSLFPEYWYFLSCVAMETGHFQRGIEACDTFFNVNRHIFRDDPMEGMVAFNKAFMLPKTDSNKQEIHRCLELAFKNNALRGDWQLDYLVAVMYKGVFGEHGKSEYLLEHAIATIEQEMRKRTRSGRNVGTTLEEGLLNCRNALHELRGEPLESASSPFIGNTKSITLPGGAEMEMICVKPSTVINGFWLGKYEVTQKQWESVMGNNPSHFKGDDLPVENVSWNDCQEFIRKVNASLNCGARLPTEAEWEYACRAGTSGPYAGAGLDSMGWCRDNSGLKTHPVGQKSPNAWGFFDMHGNVWEWCHDSYDGNVMSASISPFIEENLFVWNNDYSHNESSSSASSSGSDKNSDEWDVSNHHVLRGGSWNSAATDSSIEHDNSDARKNSYGFRLCLSSPPPDFRLTDNLIGEEDKIIASIIASQSNANLMAFMPAEDFIKVRIPYNEHLLDFGKYGLKVMKGGKCVKELRGRMEGDISRTCRVSSDGKCLILHFIGATPSNDYTFRLSYYDPNYPVEWTILNIIGESELSQIAKGRLDNEWGVRTSRAIAKACDIIMLSHSDISNPLSWGSIVGLDAQSVVKRAEQSYSSSVVSDLKESWEGCALYFYSVVVKGQEHKCKYTDQALDINDVTLDNAGFRRKLVDREIAKKIKL